MLPTTRKSHLKVVGNTKNSGGGGGTLADQEMGPWWSIDSSIRGLCLQKLISSESSGGGHWRIRKWGDGGQLTVQLCLQKLISSAPETTKNKKFLGGLIASCLLTTLHHSHYWPGTVMTSLM